MWKTFLDPDAISDSWWDGTKKTHITCNSEIWPKSCRKNLAFTTDKKSRKKTKKKPSVRATFPNFIFLLHIFSFLHVYSYILTCAKIGLICDDFISYPLVVLACDLGDHLPGIYWFRPLIARTWLSGLVTFIANWSMIRVSSISLRLIRKYAVLLPSPIFLVNIPDYSLHYLCRREVNTSLYGCCASRKCRLVRCGRWCGEGLSSPSS